MKSAFWLSIAAALASAAPTSQNTSDHPVVDLGYASFRGTANATFGVTKWLGLHYAASPTGNLRWQPPVPIEQQNSYSKSQVVNATQNGPMCLQQSPAWMLDSAADDLQGGGNASASQTEDCLLLNVKKPYHPASSSLPVAIQIHGGGYTLGSAASDPGDFLVSKSHGQIIYVEIQYRLGGLGFLNNRAVQQNGTANAGLLDQRAAIEWVKRHISSFGGDPNKITIIGGSAGGGSVTAQLQLRGGEYNPPFRGAIAEYPWWQTYHTDSVYETQYQQLLQGTQCADLTCLRKLPFSQLSTALSKLLITAYDERSYGFGDFYWGPGVDGKTILELPSSAFDSGRFSKVPTIVDRDALEGLIFSNFSLNSDAEVRADLQQVWPNANQSFFDQIDRLYPTSSFNGSYFATPVLTDLGPNSTTGQYLDSQIPPLAHTWGSNPFFFKRQQIFGDAFVDCSTRTVAAALTRFGVPVYKLVFNSGTLLHGTVDTLVLAPGNTIPGVTTDAEAAVLRAYITSFITDLNPNADAVFANVSRPVWPTYGHGAAVLFDNFTHFATGQDTDKSARCQFLLEQAKAIRN